MSQVFLPQRATVTRRDDGALQLSTPYALRPHVKRTGDWLDHWATHTPDAVFVAERDGDGWSELTYGEAHQKVIALASSLLDLGLGETAPLMLLSGKSNAHALLALAAQYVGIPSVAIAEQYSLVPAAHNKLKHVVDVIQPAAIFTENSVKFASAIGSGIFGALPIISCDGGTAFGFSDLLSGGDGDVDAAKAKVGEKTVAKYIFTSGSTSMPKAVITTHGMLTANQMQRSMAWPFLAHSPQRMVDWLPWNHGAGGSANFNMMLANGGALYLDDGGPSEKGIARSIENITLVGQTICGSVPIGLSMMAQAMRTDKVFRRAFFQDLSLVYYAAASMPQTVWDELKMHALEETGKAPEMSSGWGLTETAPSAFMVQKTMNHAGMIGVPLPGMVAKLIPSDNGAYEIRVKGPNVTPGYFNAPDKTAEAFDEEGYLITGDAVRFVDENNPDDGLAFEGRLSEDFKMSTGTFVQATKVRATAVSIMNNVVADLVICGAGRDELGALAFIKPDFLAQLADGHQTDGDGAFDHPGLLEAMTDAMKQLAEGGAGSSMRIMRMLALETPASLSEGETTDKGNLNQKLLLKTRAKWVERLYDDADPSVARLNR